MRQNKPAKSSSRNRRGAGRANESHASSSLPDIRWTGLHEFADGGGEAFQRYYKLETLGSAIEYMFKQGNDRFILPAVQQKLGPATVSSLQFSLIQENRHRLVFRLRAGNTRKKLATFAMVAAKKNLNDSTLIADEHAILRTLFTRCSKHIIQPFRGGTVYLPDRYRRADKGREIYLYLTQWLTGYQPLGVNNNAQCIVNAEAKHTFSNIHTENIKAKIIEIILCTYDEKKQNLMALPDIIGGDFYVKHVPKGMPLVKLSASRKLFEQAKPGQILSSLLNASWVCGEQHFQLAPESPELFWTSVQKALGKEMAPVWIRELIRFTSRMRKTTAQTTYLQSLLSQAGLMA